VRHEEFYFGKSISVGVRDLDRAIAWYQEEIKLRLTPIQSEDFEALLAFDKEPEKEEQSRNPGEEK
jgi:hypothetical protein